MLGLLVAAIGVFVALGADVAASRAGTSRIFAYVCSLMAGFGVILGTLLVMQLDSPWTIAIATTAYTSWWFAFLNLVQALESSLRVKLLADVRAEGGRVTLDFFEYRYNDTILLQLRLDRLRSHGAIVERAGRIYVTSPGLKLIAHFFRVLKRVLIGRTSEFESRRP